MQKFVEIGKKLTEKSWFENFSVEMSMYIYIYIYISVSSDFVGKELS